MSQSTPHDRVAANAPSSSANAAATLSHAPVMLAEVLETLDVQAGGVYVDGTFGGGGYTRAILDSVPDCRVIAIDRDPDAIARAAAVATQYPGRFQIIDGTFGDMAQHLAALGIAQVDGIVLDLGVSSYQLDEGARGFSFRFDAPLDMRMSKHGQTAADVVNTADETEIADILFHLGEERMARRIARAITAARAEAPIETTFQLRAIVHSVIHPRHDDRIDPATKTFQALRIHVNNELGELDAALKSSVKLLKPSGRLVVVSFHSLEDVRVKTYLRLRSSAAPRPSRFLPDSGEVTALFDIPEKSGLKAGDDEIALNPRARSARLRYGIRTMSKNTEAAE